MGINFSAFVSSLGYMVEGMLTIFGVMAVIIGVIYGLNRATSHEE